MQVILREHNGAIFRRCEPSDLIGVMEINMKTLPEHYSDYFYESLLAEAPEAFLVAEKDSQYVGYVSYTNLRAHETKANIVCRLLLDKKKNRQ